MVYVKTAQLLNAIYVVHIFSLKGSYVNYSNETAVIVRSYPLTTHVIGEGEK